MLLKDRPLSIKMYFTFVLLVCISISNNRVKIWGHAGDTL